MEPTPLNVVWAAVAHVVANTAGTAVATPIVDIAGAATHARAAPAGAATDTAAAAADTRVSLASAAADTAIAAADVVGDLLPSPLPRPPPLRLPRPPPRPLCPPLRVLKPVAGAWLPSSRPSFC